MVPGDSSPDLFLRNNNNYCFCWATVRPSGLHFFVPAVLLFIFFSSFLLLSPCFIYFLLYPLASVRENHRAEFPIFYSHTEWNLLSTQSTVKSVSPVVFGLNFKLKASFILSRHQQIFVDGAHWRQHRQRRSYQGARLLHSCWGVSGGQRRLPDIAQQSHVQDVLLQIRAGLHGGRWAWATVFTLWNNSIQYNKIHEPFKLYHMRRRSWPISYVIVTDMCFFIGKPAGYDRVRNVEIGNKDFELDVLEEAYTTEHWIVRIYKVKDLPNRGS